VQLLSRGDDLVEESDDGITLGLWDTNNLGDKAWVEEKRFPAGDGVRADQRMLCNDWVTTKRTTKSAGSFSLNLSGMKRCQPFQVFLHEG